MPRTVPVVVSVKTTVPVGVPEPAPVVPTWTVKADGPAGACPGLARPRCVTAVFDWLTVCSTFPVEPAWTRGVLVST